jgi:hypothetical protein
MSLPRDISQLNHSRESSVRAKKESLGSINAEERKKNNTTSAQGGVQTRNTNRATRLWLN